MRQAVLVIDGQAGNLWIAEDILERYNWTVSICSGEWAANQKLAQYAQQGKPIDLLIISDIWLPLCMPEELEQVPDEWRKGRNSRETGLRLCEFAQTLSPPPKIVLCFDVLDNERNKARALAAKAQYAKSFDFRDTLITILERQG